MATLVTPGNIRTLQRKLYRKAKQEPAYRFYALYDKVYRADILAHAYGLVRAHKGAAGIDGVTCEAIEAEEGVAAFLAALSQALKAKTYRPDPIRRVMIPKPGGGERPLGIPTLRDRVVQTAVKLVIEPIFEADFSERSYGFRPKRSAHGAIDGIAYALNCGYTHVIDADIAKCFDTLSHAKLLAAVARRIADGAILRLIKLWLKAAVVEEGKGGKRRSVGGGKGNRQGTPQGGVISPLLANLYLHLLDRIWDRHQFDKRLHARLVRYCDDFVVMCAGDVTRPQALVQAVLTRLGLTLNAAKTRVVDAHQGGFDFLGFEIRMRKSWRSGKRYAHVQPSKHSLSRVKARVTHLTRREMAPVPLEVIMERVNQGLRGWVSYFHYRNCSASFAHVKEHAEQRLRIHLRRRHKIKDRASGYRRFPNRSLYVRYGLFKVPTTAGWTSAHALR